MRKIILTPYEVSGQPYDVKQSLVAVLFAPALRLGARDAIENDRIASKIEGANGFILLEETEYQRVRQAVESFQGYGRPDTQFIQLVLDAPEIAVQEEV